MANYLDANTTRALAKAKVKGFNSDFLGLSVAHIDDLYSPPDPNVPGSQKEPLAIPKCRKLKMVMSFYHCLCRNSKEPINISSTKKSTFHQYCTQIYDPDKPIIPWTVPIATPENENLRSARDLFAARLTDKSRSPREHQRMETPQSRTETDIVRAERRGYDVS